MADAALMAGKSVLVTGGTGYLGRVVVRATPSGQKQIVAYILGREGASPDVAARAHRAGEAAASAGRAKTARPIFAMCWARQELLQRTSTGIAS